MYISFRSANYYNHDLTGKVDLSIQQGSSWCMTWVWYRCALCPAHISRGVSLSRDNALTIRINPRQYNVGLKLEILIR